VKCLGLSLSSIQIQAQGFVLLDTQFITDHLKQFGAIEIPARKYRVLLNEALGIDANFMLQ
jgi:leucyl/phenylalanyl-tRNA---protein transferase